MLNAIFFIKIYSKFVSLLVNFEFLKTLFSYILLFSLVLRPMYNIGYVAYFELNIDYLIETYCVNKEKPELQCNGKCHLATQLTNNTQDASNETSYINTLFETFVPVYFQTNTINFTFHFQNSNFQNNWSYSNMLTSLYQVRLDKPPQV